MICPSCGAGALEGSRFCPACGHALPIAAARGDERRLVTVLFADLVGYTALAETRDPEQVKNLVDRCFERLAGDIVAHGGRVDKVVGDAIIALFGAPLAHEDDAERAVRAGLQMQRTITGWSAELGVDIRMRVGIDSGEVLVGALRAGGDYTAMGDVVNTASRLQTAAQPGQVLVGSVTHAAARDVLRWESMGAVLARGREEPVEAWAAVEAVAPPGHRPRRVRTPLIGREAELGLLRHALAIAAERRRAQLVVLTGEAGTGKTRLAEELATIARNDSGAIVLEGRCVPYGEANVWWPLAEALRRSCGITSTDDRETAKAKGRAAVTLLLGENPDNREVERLMQGLIYLIDQSPTADIEPTRARDEALRSLHVCLERMTVSRPLVFVVSELHWADDLLLEFLDKLLDRVQHLPILLLATARPELADRWHPPVGRHNQVVLHVDALDPAATGRLLSELLVDAPPGKELRNTLVERSGGNPLYLEELVALLARDQPFDELPVTLRGLVAARLDGLGADERETLEDAAVVGRSGSLAALVAMGGSSRSDEIAGAVAWLVAADLLVAVDRDGGSTEWEFRSELVREVGYAILSKAERARRHAVLAEWLADRTDSRPGARHASEALDELAHHYGTAAELVKELGGIEGVPSDLNVSALYWVELAAARAGGQELWPAAESLLDQALRLAPSIDPAAVTRLSLARARARVGTRDIAGATADLAVVSKGSTGDAVWASRDEALEVQVLVLTGEVERIDGRTEQSIATLERAVEMARTLGDEQAFADAMRALGQTRLLANDGDGADAASVEALGAYRNLGDRRGEAWALQSLAWAAFLRGDLGPAEDRLRVSADAFSEIGDWGGYGWAMGLLGWVRFSQGRLDEAEELGRRLLDDMQTGDRWAVGMMIVLLANVNLWKGRTNQAVKMATEARALFIEIHDTYGETQALTPLTRGLLAVGDIEAGRRILDELADSARAVPDPRMRTFQVGMATGALTQQLGEGPTALGLALELVDSESEHIIPEQRAMLGLALLQSGRVGEALPMLERAVLGFHSDGSNADVVVPQPNIGPMLALGYLAAGRVEEAADTLAVHTGPELGTYNDRMWAGVARGFLTLASGDHAALPGAFGVPLAEIDATEDRLGKATVLLAYSVALSAGDQAGLAEQVAAEAHQRLGELGVSLSGWEKVFRLVAGEPSAPDAVAIAG